MGHTLSGFYDVKSSSSQIASTYCDFTKASTEPGYETRYGFVDVKTSPVHFFVTRSSSWSTLNVAIPFQKEYLNVGGGMTLTSGVFKAPKAGIYAFSFSAEALGSSSAPSQGIASVKLNRNGVSVAYGHNHVDISAVAHVTASVHTTLKLNVGDEITTSITSSKSQIGGDTDGILFMGSLLEEDLVIST